MNGLQWAADLLQHFFDCCASQLPALPLLRGLQSVVRPLLACDRRVSGDGLSVLTHDA